MSRTARQLHEAVTGACLLVSLPPAAVASVTSCLSPAPLQRLPLVEFDHCVSLSMSRGSSVGLSRSRSVVGVVGAG